LPLPATILVAERTSSLQGDSSGAWPTAAQTAEMTQAAKTVRDDL